MHANTRLTPYSRRRLVTAFLAGTPMKELAVHYGVSRKTGYAWVRRYRTDAQTGLANRTSRPRRSYRCLDAPAVTALLAERQRTGWGIRRLARRHPASPSTVHRILRQHGLHRRRPQQLPVVRYEAQHPGQLVHLDTMQLFALKGGKPVYQYTVVDDHTRQAFALLAPRRGSAPAVQALQAAQQAFGYRFRRVMTDNDVIFTLAARPDLWRDRWHRAAPPATAFDKACTAMRIRHVLTRVRRPQTNGKVERLHRTMREECWWPHFASEEERHAALAAYLPYYNGERPHQGIGGLTPNQRKDAYFASTVLPTS